MITIIHRLKAATLMLSCFVVPLLAQAQTEYPKPTSEYSEETAPGTQVLLSYPKYYRDAEGKLVLVNTTIVPAKDTICDYEVTQGIWQLKVRKDGTFQAEHEGDVFTYRFNSLGTGRGSGFKPFDLGEADFTRFIVTGDTIRWSNVYPDIDLSVRYIHDILKVDVIVKNAFMADLKAEAKSGSLDKEDYLTARFDIPQVLLTSKPVQNGQEKDLFMESLNVDQPIYFEKNGKPVHKIKPVEVFQMDAYGNPLINPLSAVRTGYVWNLNRNGSGVAEMSASISDLVDLPEGDVFIDPVITMVGANRDSKITNVNPNNNYGSSSTVGWNLGTLYQTAYDERLLFGFGSNVYGANTVIVGATLEVYETAQSWIGANGKARAQKVLTTWTDSNVTWTAATSSTNWTSSGGDIPSNADWYYSPTVTLPTTGNQWMRFDVTQIMRSHYLDSSSANNLAMRGFLIKPDTSTQASFTVAMTEYGTTDYRPRLVVNWKTTGFGADAGNTYDDANNGTRDSRLSKLAADNMKYVRLFLGEPANQVQSYLQTAQNKNMKVVVNISPHLIEGYHTCSVESLGNFQTRVNQTLSPLVGYIPNPVVAIEIGNEEAKAKWEVPCATDYWWCGSATGGDRFGEYYRAAYDIIDGSAALNQADIMLNASLNTSYGYGFTSQSAVGSNSEFLRGIIHDVTSTVGAGYKKMPDIISIHNYSGDYDDYQYSTGVYPPEHIDKAWSGDYTTRRTELFDRLGQLLALCNTRGFVPMFAQTEYGYSPTPDFDHAPYITDATAQAVYYLRSKLIVGTSLDYYYGLGWRYDFYFHHPNDYDYSPPKIKTDYGFYGTSGIGTRRAVSHAAALLHSATRELQFGADEMFVWVPAQNQLISSEAFGDVKYAWCGWETEDDQLWGAIWKYRTYGKYEDFANETRNFIVNQNLSGATVYVYKINLSSTPDQLTYQTSIPVLPGYWDGTRTAIPISTVDENPSFLMIQ